MIQNKWVGYLDRTYQQIRDSAITKMGVDVPEITDHTESNPYIIEIGVWAGMTEHLNYYIDNAAREAFLATARLYDSMVKMARFSNYRIRGVKSSNADLTFTLSQSLPNNYPIPIGTVVSTDDGIQFITTVGDIIPAGSTSIVIPASQMVMVNDAILGISNGTAGQRFPLTEDTEDRSIVIKINGVFYSFTDDISKASYSDNVFTTSLNISGVMEVVFGDGIFGSIPPSGSTIYVSYGLSKGTAGNLAENTIINIDSQLSNVSPASISVTNLNKASGGADIETLEELRKAIPKYNRTNKRAVTKQDYQDIAELNAGVRAADAQFKCGKTVDVYIVPKGGGVAPQTLLDSVKDDFYDETRMITTQVRVLPAGEVMLNVEWDIYVLPAFSKIDVEQSVRSVLMTYVNDSNLELFSKTEIGNLYEIIEAIKGVDYSKMVKLYVRPFARITFGETVLNWDREIKETSSELVNWTLKFSSAGEFELLRNSQYFGTYMIDQTVSLPELSFKILTGNYVAGDTWQFVTYPYSNSIALAEPSVLVLEEANLKLNMYGGI